MFKKEKLSDLLNKRGITYEELAANIGVSRAFVGYLLKGYKEPSLAVAKRIADYFEISLDELTE